MTDEGDDRAVDPGDAVPEGVAPKYPPPLSEEELAVKRKLEELGKRGGENTSGDPAPRG